MYSTTRMKELHFVEKSKPDACYQQRKKISRLFNAYLTQMMAKLFVGLIFLVLEIMYFSHRTDFPLKYDCEYRRTSLNRPIHQLNSNAFVMNVSIATGPGTERYSCTYQIHGIKSLFIVFFYTLNVSFLVTLSSEILYIWIRARREKQFKEDVLFSAVHLRCEDPGNYSSQASRIMSENQKKYLDLSFLGTSTRAKHHRTLNSIRYNTREWSFILRKWITQP